MLWMWAVTALAAGPATGSSTGGASPSAAGPPIDLAEEAELHFQLGVKDYSAGQLDEALSHLLRSYRLAPNRSTAFNIARVYDGNKRPAAAWRYYALALEGEADPELRIPIEQAMTRLEPMIARVQVTTEPPGATVYVGSRDLGARGVSPMTIALDPGKYDLLFDLPGHSPVEIPRLFPTQGLFEVAATLERNASDRRQVAIERTWVETTVFVSGEVVARVAPGRCDILPDRVQHVATWREPTNRIAGPVPGSAVAAPVPMSDALDVVMEAQGRRRVTRVPLSRASRKGWYEQAALVHAWALDRCEITNAAALGDTLEDLPKKLREPVATLLAEMSAPSNIAEAVKSCVKGECAGFSQGLR